MIAEAVVEKVRHLLADGALSQRKIARRLGVSRGTVNAISQGRRPDYSQDGRRRRSKIFPFRRGCRGVVRAVAGWCRCRVCCATFARSAGLTGGGESDRKADAFRPRGR